MYIDKYFRRQIVRKLCLAQKMTNLTYYVKILSIIQKLFSIWDSREVTVLAVLLALTLESQTISWSVWKYMIRRAALFQKKPFMRRSVWANSCKLLKNINSLLLVMRLNQRDTKISQLLWRWISKELNGRLLDTSLWSIWIGLINWCFKFICQRILRRKILIGGTLTSWKVWVNIS